MNYFEQHKACTTGANIIIRPTDNVHICKTNNGECRFTKCQKSDDRRTVPFQSGLVMARDV